MALPARLVPAIVTAAIVGACTSSSPASGPDTAAPTTGAVTADAPPGDCGRTVCSLREAAAAADFSIGVHLEEWDPATLPLVVEQFDRVSVHGVTIEALQPAAGEFRFEAADQMMEFAREHQLATHGFHWLWSQTLLDSNPSWIAGIDDPDELWEVLEEHLSAVVERYPDLGRLNVVNEPLEVTGGARAQNQYHRVLGAGYVTEAFARAAAIAPGYELFLNENLVEYDPAKADAFLALVEEIVAAGAPIDGVGLQMHLVFGEPDWALLDRLLTRFDELGLVVAITELDAPVRADVDDRAAVQAARMAGVVAVCIEHDACDSVIIWGVHDGATWLDWFLEPGLDPLLYDADLEPKPSWFAVLDTLIAAGG